MIKAIFTNIKNEHLYLEEWIEYNIRLGFNKFIIFEDEGSESHEDIINKYCKVTNIDFYTNMLRNDSEEIKELTCFKYIVKNYNDIDWLIYLNPDEYIKLNNNMTIDDIAYEYKNSLKQISLFCKLYNACGLINQPSYSSYSLLDTYIGDIEIYNLGKYFTNNVTPNANYSHSRSLLNYKMYRNDLTSIDNPTLSNSFPDKFIEPSPIMGNIGHINHYITKSFEEFYNKLEFNKGNKYHSKKIGDFFVLNPDMISKIPVIESKYNIDVFASEKQLAYDN